MAFTWTDIINGEIASSIRSKLNLLGTEAETLDTSVTQNTANISTNTSNISTLQGQMTTAQSNIATNTTNITTNTTNITTNTTNIGNLTNLTTGSKTNIVDAVNENVRNIRNNSIAIWENRPQLLWENERRDDIFVAQTVSVPDLDRYMWLLVVGRLSTDSALNTQEQFTNVFNRFLSNDFSLSKARFVNAQSEGYRASSVFREMTVIANSIEFGNGRRTIARDGIQTSIDDDAAVPIAIYGIK